MQCGMPLKISARGRLSVLNKNNTLVTNSLENRMFSGFCLYYAIERVKKVLNGIENALNRISNFMLFGFKARMNNKEFLEQEIMRWKGSPERIMQIKGQLYYQNEHDILTRKRTMIGEDGKLQTVENLPNNRLIDNQYGKMVNQKQITF